MSKIGNEEELDEIIKEFKRDLQLDDDACLHPPPRENSRPAAPTSDNLFKDDAMSSSEEDEIIKQFKKDLQRRKSSPEIQRKTSSSSKKLGKKERPYRTFSKSSIDDGGEESEDGGGAWYKYVERRRNSSGGFSNLSKSLHIEEETTGMDFNESLDVRMDILQIPTQEHVEKKWAKHDKPYREFSKVQRLKL